MSDENGNTSFLETPSRSQELALAILPIPSAILSVIGSSVIIYMSVATRHKRKWTPYTRLLLGLSFYDIVGSVTLAIATFLRDENTSPRPFSFGTSTSCSMVGAFNQLSYGTLVYNGMLSLYFLFTARFGFSNAYIARVIEPWMHIICNGFSVSTSVAALAIGAYGEMAHANGCWVADYPRGCGQGPECTSRLIGWLYFGLPSILIFICLFINNLIIFMFVRRHTKRRTSKRISAVTTQLQTGRNRSSSSSQEEEDESASSEFLKRKYATNETYLRDDQDSRLSSQLRDQAERLRLVSTQAFLYVFFFLLCNVWTGVVGMIESSGDTKEKELQCMVDYYVFFALQAALAPLNGLFNMLVFVRPKYHLCRLGFPRETRLWVVRRTIFGSLVKPTHTNSQSGSTGASQRSCPLQKKEKYRVKAPLTNTAATTRLPRKMMSSMTASEGDFDDSDDRSTENADSSLLSSLSIRFQSRRNPRSSVLEAISENEASTFEHTSSDLSMAEAFLLERSSTDFKSPIDAEKRWSCSNSSLPLDASAAQMPQRVTSSFEEPDRSTFFQHLTDNREENSEIPLLTDKPVKVPVRRLSIEAPIEVSQHKTSIEAPMKIP